MLVAIKQYLIINGTVIQFDSAFGTLCIIQRLQILSIKLQFFKDPKNKVILILRKNGENGRFLTSLSMPLC